MLKIAVPTNRPQAVSKYLEALTESGAQGTVDREFPSPEAYDGLLLPGGCDVNPARYGKDRIPQETIDDELDTLQFETLARFLEAGKPVLGICRGHQLLNIAFGGTLIQHLPGAEKHQSIPTGEDNVHSVIAEEGSFLHRIYGSRFAVNSSHHQGVGTPGKGLKIVLRSEDGVVEGIGHESLPVWGVQFHPERMCFNYRREDTADGSGIFRFFLEQCQKNRDGL